MNHQSPEEPTADELDNLIFSNRKLEALQLLRAQRGIILAEALEALTKRYQYLRTAFPEKFTCDDVEYWRGFYS